MSQFQTLHDLPHQNSRLINELLVIIGLISSTFAMAINTYTSIHIMHQFKIQNILNICTWLFAVALYGIYQFSFTKAGFGKHEMDLSKDELHAFTWALLTTVVIFIAMMCMGKLGVIALYYRLDPISKLWRISVYAIAIIIVIPTPVLILIYIFGCQPLSMAWNMGFVEGHCISRVGIMLTSSVLNATIDILMVLIPIPLIIRLQIPVLHKLGALAMLSLGCLTVVTSICRAIALSRLLHLSDQPYNIVIPILWANAETTLVIICNCLPAFRRFIQYHFTSSASTGSKNSTVLPASAGDGITEQRGREHEYSDDVELIYRDGSNPLTIVRTVELNMIYHLKAAEPECGLYPVGSGPL